MQSKCSQNAVTMQPKFSHFLKRLQIEKFSVFFENILGKFLIQFYSFCALQIGSEIYCTNLLCIPYSMLSLPDLHRKCVQNSFEKSVLGGLKKQLRNINFSCSRAQRVYNCRQNVYFKHGIFGSELCVTHNCFITLEKFEPTILHFLWLFKRFITSAPQNIFPSFFLLSFLFETFTSKVLWKFLSF